MRPAKDGGSRFGIVLNGSPLFTGGAGSGESEIRRYVLENDLVEAIIGLPTDMFYNTGISTYVWIVSNRKAVVRQGKVQLIDASSYWQKMRKSLGSKRKEISPEQIDHITQPLANPWPAAACATQKMCRSPKMRKPISSAKCSPTRPMLGSTKKKPKSATKSPSTAIFTSSNPLAP
jgi:type I restriction enzyme M protein